MVLCYFSHLKSDNKKDFQMDKAPALNVKKNKENIWQTI